MNLKIPFFEKREWNFFGEEIKSPEWTSGPSINYIFLRINPGDNRG